MKLNQNSCWICRAAEFSNIILACRWKFTRVSFSLTYWVLPTKIHKSRHRRKMDHHGLFSGPSDGTCLASELSPNLQLVLASFKPLGPYNTKLEMTKRAFNNEPWTNRIRPDLLDWWAGRRSCPSGMTSGAPRWTWCCRWSRKPRWTPASALPWCSRTNPPPSWCC